jgi:hypothetical protein
MRLVIAKATWRNDAASPVMLGIDDLTNAWHRRPGCTGWEAGGDWGGGLARQGSAFRFLDDRLLRDFPEARVTFFTVAGPISPYTHHQPFTYARTLDDTEDSREFFRSLSDDERFELAYHGLNHGTPGTRSEEFLQEFRGFSSVACAVSQTHAGLEIFRRATGQVPAGGKYGGYDYNEFAEDALNECGFQWWCRDWTPRNVTGAIADGYYEPQFFGRNLMVSLPSAVHGFYWNPAQIELLIARRQMITIAEHISPARPDGQIQTPNLFDDIGELRRLYSLLRGKPVWHATGSEIASYVVARERSLVYDVTRDGFSIKYDGRIARPVLTLQIDAAAICTHDEPLIAVTQPDGTTVEAADCHFDRARYRHLVTVRVMEGPYRVRACAA